MNVTPFLKRVKLKNARLNFTPVIMLIERVPITGNRSAEKLLWNAKGLANVGRKVGNLSSERIELLSDCLCVIDRD